MNINLRTGEIISQNKLDALKIAAELGQITVEIDCMECIPEYTGKAVAFNTYNIQYMVTHVTNKSVYLQQVATYPCRDCIQICKYYCAVNNGFGCIEVSPSSIQDYEYIIVPDIFIVEV